MKFYRKLFIVLASLLVLILLVNVGLNFWIKYQLPQIISEQNKSPYEITFDDISVSLVSQNIQATDIIVIPKAPIKDKKKHKGIYARVKKVEVVSFKIWDVVFNDKISARSLIISDPDLTFYKSKIKEDDDSKTAERMNKIITVSDLFINNGRFELVQLESNKRLAYAANIDFNLEGILVTEQTLKQKLPLTYREYTFGCDSIFYSAGKFYNLRADAFRATDREASLKNVKVIPRYSRSGFIKAIDKETDLFAISIDSATIRNMIWGFKNEELFYSAQSLNLQGLNANIYRNKMVADNTEKKKLYSEALRNLKFDLKIDTMRIRNSTLAYEEAKNEAGAGKLTFNNFNLTATAINSGYKKTKLPNTDIRINCRLMNAAKLETEWTFNVMNEAEAFNIKGRIFDLPLEHMSAFTKPYLNAKTKGIIDRVYFNFSGTDTGVKGDFAIEYDDLKVEIYRKKDRKKKNKILTAITNLFVKNDTNDEVTTAEVDVERDQQKSFFNLVWISIADGMKKILV